MLNDTREPLFEKQYTVIISTTKRLSKNLFTPKLIELESKFFEKQCNIFSQENSIEGFVRFKNR